MRRGGATVAAVVIEPVTGASGAPSPLPGVHRRAAARLRPPRAAARVRRDDHRVRAHGRVVRRLPLARREPDIITFAKGVTSGIVPFSGVLVRGEVAELFEQSPEGFPYGHTFSGYPLGCAVAAEAIRVIRDEGLVAESRRKGALLRARLDLLAASSPHVGDVRGLGLLQGLELVRTGRRSPPPGAAARLVKACRERGLMIYACATPNGATTIEAVMLAPPLTISDDELDQVVADPRRGARRVFDLAPQRPLSAGRARNRGTRARSAHPGRRRSARRPAAGS